MSDNAAHTKHCACALELDRTRANANQLIVLMETFIYEPHKVSEGGLIAQIQRFRTDQDVYTEESPRG